MRFGAHLRLFLLVVACTACALGAVGAAQLHENAILHRLATLETEEQRHAVAQAITLNVRRAQTLSVDYSYWDELVTTAESPTVDTAWVHDNLDSALQTYAVDAIWVFRVDGTEVVAVTQPAARDLTIPPWSAAETQKFLTTGPFHEEYVATPRGPVALFAATIHPGDDVAHSTPPRGLIVVGKLLDAGFLAEIETETNSHVGWVGTVERAAVAPSDIAVEVPIRQADGSTIATLGARTTVPALAEISAASRRIVILLSATALLDFVGTTIALRAWVVLPLSALTEALTVGHDGPLAATRRQTDEFGQLARLIDIFFAQQRALEHEVEERGALARALEARAMHDPLTGLPNRALFNDRLTQALAQARRNDTLVSVIAVDLDRFKNINDTHGHAAGDELLIQVGERLRAAVRATDTVARLGGDEFIVLLPHVGSADMAMATARRILTAFHEPFALTTATIPMSLSLGVCLFPTDAACAAELLHRADLAMYDAKQAGRDGVRIWRRPPQDP